jgi:hypothetical protein
MSDHPPCSALTAPCMWGLTTETSTPSPPDKLHLLWRHLHQCFHFFDIKYCRVTVKQTCVIFKSGLVNYICAYTILCPRTLSRAYARGGWIKFLHGRVHKKCIAWAHCLVF